MAKTNKTTVIYPGTFDPITLGHMDIINRARKMFDEVIVAVSSSKDKTPMFNLDERLEMIEIAIKDCPKVSYKSFDTLLVKFSQEQNCKTIVRGLRAISDFEYELQLGYANRSLSPDIDTIYLMPSLNNAFVSSSIVRSILKHDTTISHLVPAGVDSYIFKKLEK
jgi:pantetheine-phosphate adenylyltransferase